MGKRIFSESFSFEDKKITEEDWKIESLSGRSGEWGSSLVATEDGGLILGGNFDRSWMLGMGENNKTAISPLLRADEDNIESFIAQYDQNGTLLWAQTSGMIGNDFATGLFDVGMAQFG